MKVRLLSGVSTWTPNYHPFLKTFLLNVVPVYIITGLDARMFYFEDAWYISGTKIKDKNGLIYFYINMITLEVSNSQLCNSL